MHRRLLLWLALFLPLTALAQTPPRTPADFLGYGLGNRFTPHHRVIDYVEHVAAHAPNVRVEPYGTTYEGRPLVAVFVSSPANMARLEEIRTNNLKRAGLLPGEPVGTSPAIVWLSYNVHGNESVSTEAAMATLYDLVNPADARTAAWLEHTVVVIDPCINPDGRERYVQWYNQTVGATPNPRPEAREHHEPWPGGRTNHYYFDLNRDWAWMQQQETQHRVPLYNRWLPHVHVDFHEQGVDEPYYFAPAAEPFHEDITDWQRAFQTTLGRNHARYFDANGWLYFTRQVFDLFYPGYGDTWPTYNGAVGMTYEQGGSGRAGLGIITSEADTLTLADRIAHHHTTSLSTIETSARHHAELVDAFGRFYAEAQATPPGTYKTYVLKHAGAEDRIRALAAHLDAQEIRYGYATRRHTARGFHYADGQTREVAVEPGDLLVSAYQPKSVLVKVLFEPRSALADSVTYDITAWALPYAYGLDAYALPERLDADAQAPPAPAEAETAGDRDARPYAYLAEWKSLDDLRFLAALLQAGIKLRFAEKPFEIAGRAYAPGTLILTRTGNTAMGDRFDRVIRETAAALGQPLHPVTTGFVTHGADFGSDDVPFLGRTRVAVLTGAPVSSYATGEVWHFFDQQLRYPVTLLHADGFDPADLRDYEVLILPGGSYGRFLTDERLAALKTWVRQGGRIIAMEGAAAALAGKEDFALQPKKAAEPGDSLDQRLRTYGDREREGISGQVPGSIYRVHVDNTHPLGFGYGDTYFALKLSDDAYTFMQDGWNVGVVREDGPVSGFTGYKVRQKLEDTLAFGVQEMGRGEVVYLVDNPLFRGFWYNGKLLFGNAVFMVGR